VGASFHIRVVAKLVMKAASLLNKAELAPMRFFKTKNEAYAWFDERRRELGRASGT
jgi:hypothetical protein